MCVYDSLELYFQAELSLFKNSSHDFFALGAKQNDHFSDDSWQALK